jgi:hypothetical protein
VAPGVLRAGLLGDHIHVITAPGTQTAETIRNGLSVGLPDVDVSVESADVTLEDVFTALAGPGTRQE